MTDAAANSRSKPSARAFSGSNSDARRKASSRTRTRHPLILQLHFKAAVGGDDEDAPASVAQVHGISNDEILAHVPIEAGLHNQCPRLLRVAEQEDARPDRLVHRSQPLPQPCLLLSGPRTSGRSVSEDPPTAGRLQMFLFRSLMSPLSSATHQYRRLRRILCKENCP